MVRSLLGHLFCVVRGGLQAIAGLLAGEWWSRRRLHDVHLSAIVERPSSILRVVRGRLMVKGWVIDTVRNIPVPVRVVVGGQIWSALADRRPDVAGGSCDGNGRSQTYGFSVSIKLRPGVRLLSIHAQAEDGRWHTIRRTLLVVRRKSRPRRHTTGRRLGYGSWHDRELKALETSVQGEILRHIAAMTVQPTFTVVIDFTRGRDGLENTLRSLEQQVYSPHEVCGLGLEEAHPSARIIRDHPGGRLLVINGVDGRPGSHVGQGIRDIRGSHCVFVDAGDTLDRHALYEFASAINAAPELDIVYADEDVIDEHGRLTNPFFKPDWSPDYLEVFNYIEFPCCYRSDAVVYAYREHCLYSLALRATESARKVVHVPKVLGHRRVINTAINDRPGTQAALQDRLKRTGRRGRVLPHPVHPGCNVIEAVQWEQPRVSVIIPTAGRSHSIGGRGVDLLTNLIVQIRTRSTCCDAEIIVIDSGTLTETQIGILQEYGCRRTTDAGRDVNIARKINRGAELATGEYLLIVNDEIEILTPEWIGRMHWHFQKPDVGVVGCRLLYRDGTLQHAGVVFVNGEPEYVRRWMPGDEAGYFFSTCAARNYLAVTGACMMTTRVLFLAVGGYDETFPLTFNDVDYCLKARQRGKRVVYEGGVALTHLESVSRPLDDDSPHHDEFIRRWAAEIAIDPYYNERVFNLYRPAFKPELNPRQI